METITQTTENQSLSFLEKALEYNGFGALVPNLKQNIQHQRDRFTLHASDREPDKQGQSLKYELNFSSKDDKYYWNTTKATLVSPDPNKNGRQHTFFAGKYSANQNQMKQLLSGASVFRNKLENSETKKVYSAWQKIHFNEETNKYGDHPLKNYYENNGPRIDGALAKYNDMLVMTNSQRANAIELWKKGDPAILHVTFKEDGFMRQEKAVVFFDAQYKDLTIVRPNGEVLEKDYNNKRGENIVAVDASPRDTAQENTTKNTPAQRDGQGQDNTKAVPSPENGPTSPKDGSLPMPGNSQPQGQGQASGNDSKAGIDTPLTDQHQGQTNQPSATTGSSQSEASLSAKEEAKNTKRETPEVKQEDRQSKSDKRGVRHGR